MNATANANWDSASTQLAFALRLTAAWHESLQKMRHLDVEAADDAARAFHECAVKAAQARDVGAVWQLTSELMQEGAAASMQYYQRAAAIGVEGAGALVRDLQETFAAVGEFGTEWGAAWNLPGRDLVQGVPFALVSQATKVAPNAATKKGAAKAR